MNLDDILNEKIKKVHGKWALVSKSDPDKVLQYYHGKDHPSKEWEKKVERRVHAFSEAESLDKTIDRMRNLNIDPDFYLDKMQPQTGSSEFIPLWRIVKNLQNKFPHLKLGYFNQPIKVVK